MFVLVCYDVSTQDKEGERRLHKVAKICECYGQRVQKSVFELLLEEKDYLIFENKILNTMDLEKDNLRIYFLNQAEKTKIKVFGTKKIIDPEGPLII